MSADKNAGEKNDIKDLSKYLAAAGDAAVSLTILILAGIYGGQWLDEKFHTTPWLSLTLAIAGLSLGLWRIISKTMKLDRPE